MPFMLNRACVSGACLQLSAPPLQLSALRWNGADIVWRHYPAFVSGLLMDPQSNDVPCSSKLLPPHPEADRRIGGVGGRLHGRGGLLNPVNFRTFLFFLVCFGCVLGGSAPVLLGVRDFDSS